LQEKNTKFMRWGFHIMAENIKKVKKSDGKMDSLLCGV